MIEDLSSIVRHSFQSLIRAGRTEDLESMSNTQLDTGNADLAACAVNENRLTGFSACSEKCLVKL